MSIIQYIKNIFNGSKMKSFISTTMVYVRADSTEVNKFTDHKELWLNNKYSLPERLKIAQSAIRYKDRVIHNLKIQVSQTNVKSKNEEMRLQIAHLKANNNDLTNRNAFLRDRHDLPAHRIPAYNKLLKLQEENALLKGFNSNASNSFEPLKMQDGWIIIGPKNKDNPDIIVMEHDDIETMVSLVTNNGRYGNKKDYKATKIYLHYTHHHDVLNYN